MTFLLRIALAAVLAASPLHAHSETASNNSPVAACPPPKLRVAVDIGHSKQRGALSARGVREFEFNDRFARELVAAAASQLRLDLFLISPDKDDVGLTERPQLAAAGGADVFISIHHDSAQLAYFQPWTFDGVERRHAAGIRGYSLFVSKENPHFAKSTDLARAIGNNFRAAGARPTLHHAEPIKGENRELLDPRTGVYEAPFAVLRLSAMPAVLIEAGVVANKDDEAQLNAPAYRSTLQQAILAALSQFCPPPSRP